MKQWPAYPKYKDSGIEWLGEIPQSWEEIPVRFLIEPRNGIKIGPFGSQLKSEFMRDRGYKVYGQENVINHDFTLGSRYVDDEKFNELSVCEIYPDDIVVTMMGTTGCSQVVPGGIEKGIMDSHLLRIRVDSSMISPEFLSLLIDNASYIKHQILIEGKGSIMHGLNSQIIKSLDIVLPSTEEQTAIASFLDRETERIDSLIAKKQRQIELLQEKRSALISHSVTKGIPPHPPLEKGGRGDLKMKDSGIEWLGEVPEHWEVLRLKHSATLVNKKIDGSSSELPYIGLENIESWTGKPVNGTESSKSEGQSNLFKAGDVLFGKLRPYLAKVFYPENDGICTGELLVLRPNEVVGDFLFYYLLARDFIMIVDSSTYGAKMPRANWDFIGNLPSLIPPLKEQNAIASFLDRETSRIDTIIKKVKTSIEKLREYRSALISAAVTGKIDVREETA